MNTDPGGNLSESFDVEALFRIKLSGTTSAATSVCSLVQVDSVVVPAPNRRQAGSEESRRFCVSSRDGKMWVIEWSLLNLTCCNEINCVDLQKQMRFKNDSLQSQGGLAVSEQEGEKGGHKSYKLDGVATALTAASIATTAVRVETVFSVLAMSASGGKNVTSASSGTPRTAVFIITSNGVLITVDVEVIFSVNCCFLLTFIYSKCACTYDRALKCLGKWWSVRGAGMLEPLRKLEGPGRLCFLPLSRLCLPPRPPWARPQAVIRVEGAVE